MADADGFATDVRHTFTQQLSTATATKTDALLREAVTRFLGRSDWSLDELKGRAVMYQLPNKTEVFCLDGVPLLKLHPLTVEHERNVITTARQYRFLVPAVVA